MLRQRGKNVWQVVVYGGLDPVSGRERKIYRTVHGSRRKAEDEERRLTLEARAQPQRRHGYDDIEDPTVSELLDRWVDHARPRLAVKTVYNYERLIEVRIKPGLGAIRVDRLTPARLDRFYADLGAGRVGGRALSAKTVRNVHAILHRALHQAQRWGWIVRNPAALADPPSHVVPDIEPPSPATLSRFISWLLDDKDPDFGALCWVAATTGARRGELAGLRWSDLDVEGPSILICRSIVQVGGQLVVKETKTRAARRLAVGPRTIEILAAHRSRQAELAWVAGVAPPDDGWVFANPDGRNLHPDTISSWFRKYADEFGLPGRLHDLRHFTATEALALGFADRTVAGRLGHANPSMTMNVYGHFRPASDGLIAAALEQALDG